MTTQVFMEVKDTFPRVYALTDPPAPNPKVRWSGYQFQPAPAFVIHSKMHQHEKPQAYVVRGVGRGGRLLVQTVADVTEYDRAGTWHEVECGDTVEGYRFKRYVLKPITNLIKLATTIARVRKTEAAKAAHKAARDEKCGECSVCFGDYVVTEDDVAGHATIKVPLKVVHHGYQRPGIGYIVGDCHGVGYAPFEISCEGTKAWLADLKRFLHNEQEALRKLPERDETLVQCGQKQIGGRWLPDHKTVKRGEPGFDAAINELRRKFERTIKALNQDIALYGQKIADWQPRPFPRVTK